MKTRRIPAWFVAVAGGLIIFVSSTINLVFIRAVNDDIRGLESEIEDCDQEIEWMKKKLDKGERGHHLAATAMNFWLILDTLKKAEPEYEVNTSFPLETAQRGLVQAYAEYYTTARDEVRDEQKGMPEGIRESLTRQRYELSPAGWLRRLA